MFTLSHPITQDLHTLQRSAEHNEEENQQFRIFLKQQDGLEVDQTVHLLNNQVSSIVDCTKCGNCCRSLMINVEPGEPEILSQHLGVSTAVFKEMYIEESQQGQMIVNTIPCHFLDDNKCSVYEYRFNECREFPHLHKPGFTSRLFGTLMHYGRCPIIYNVIEELKYITFFKSRESSFVEVRNPKIESY